MRSGVEVLVGVLSLPGHNLCQRGGPDPREKGDRGHHPSNPSLRPMAGIGNAREAEEETRIGTYWRLTLFAVVRHTNLLSFDP